VQQPAGLLQQQVGDPAQLLAGELVEDDDLVDAVEELGPEVVAQRPQDLLAPLLVGLGVTSLSMAPVCVPAVREALAGLTLAECRERATAARA
jgi:hypothetical protein